MRSRSRIVPLVAAIAVTGLLLCLLSCCLLTRGGNRRGNAVVSSTGTRVVVDATPTKPNDRHEAEVTEVIEEFEIWWSQSKESRTPAEAAMRMTWPFSDYRASGVISVTIPYTVPGSRPLRSSILTEVEFIHLEVMEYTPDYFRATAHMTFTIQRTDASGSAPTVSEYQRRECRVYAFAWEDGVWKLAGAFFVPMGARGWHGIEDSWTNLPEAVKEVLGGDLPPEGFPCHW